MEMISISIIIPSLNEANYIERALRSIKNQSFQELEIIVVDGGSSDRTVEIAKNYADLVLIEKSNIAEARNIGAEHARGGVLVFLDADCAIGPDFALKCREIFSSREVAAAYGKMVPFEEEMTFKLRLLVFTGWRLVPKLSLLVKNPILPGACMVVRRSAFESINGFRADLDTSEDIDLYRRLAKNGIVLSDELVFSASMRRFSKGGVLRWIYKWVTNYFYYLRTGRTGLKRQEYGTIR